MIQEEEAMARKLKEKRRVASQGILSKYVQGFSNEKWKTGEMKKQPEEEHKPKK
jgi:hypothetical protein